MTSLLLLLLSAAPECVKDADCQMVDHDGCCAACCPVPHARPSKQVLADVERCALTRYACSACDQPCPAVPPTSDYEAKCAKGSCQAVLRASAKTADPRACAADTDCVVVDHEGCCGCCDQPLARNAKTWQAEQRSCAAAANQCKPCSGACAVRVEAFSARCEHKQCVAVPKTTAKKKE
jgi:hypothetical protein